jgi:MOSC domain-containing protein YiiM
MTRCLSGVEAKANGNAIGIGLRGHMIKTLIDALLIGGPKPFRADGTMSAMARDATSGPVQLTKTGFAGDQVADPSVHGGPDKAVHFYPPEHYPFWSVKLDGHLYLNHAGAFGENVSAGGLTENVVKIGDRFQLGQAVVEISQGRQPCWKLDHHFGVHGLAGEFIRTGRCGFYFRVIEEGDVAAGDVIEQVETSTHDWTVERTFRMLIGGGHRAEGAKAGLRELADMGTLADVWRARAVALLR